MTEAPPVPPPPAPPHAPPSDDAPLPPVLGAPGLGEIGPHSLPGPDPPPRPPRPPDPRDAPRMRTAGGLLVLIGAFGAVLFGFLAVTVLMAVPWHGDAPGGALTVRFGQGVGLDPPPAIVRVEDLRGDWRAEQQTGTLGSAHFQLPHAHARVTIEEEGRTWQREVFVPEGRELTLDLDPDDAATADGVVGAPRSGPLWFQIGVGLVTAAVGLLVRRGRALGFALLWSWLLGLIATLAGIALLFLGQPGALPQLLVGLGLLWCGWAVQRGREALRAPPAAPPPPPPPAPPEPPEPPAPPAAPQSP